MTLRLQGYSRPLNQEQIISKVVVSFPRLAQDAYLQVGSN